MQPSLIPTVSARRVVPSLLLCLLAFGLFGAGPLAAEELPWDAGNLIDAATDRGYAVAVGDVDLDGDLDVFATSRNTSTPSEVDLYVWRNGGDGTTWIETAIEDRFLGAADIQVADIDGDGDLDAVAAGFQNGGGGFFDEVVFYRNAGAGQVWTPVPVDGDFAGAVAVAIGDVDGDGDLDLAGGSMNVDDVVWWENVGGGGGTWTRRTIDSIFNGARGLALSDIDGDGDLDVVAAGEFEDQVAWWENTDGTGLNFGARQVISVDPVNTAGRLCAADLDGDGDPDVAVVSETDDEVLWFENTAGDGSAWTEATIEDNLNGAHGIACDDLDGDGDLDVVSTSRFGSGVFWWQNVEGDGSVWTEQTIDGAFFGRGVAIGDVDGDGDLDALATGDNDRVEWWADDSIHPRPAFPLDESLAALDGPRGVTLADFDGDGDLDVAASAQDGGQVVLLENLGDGTYASTTLASLSGPVGLAASDLDGDGDIDLAVAVEGAQDLVWLANPGGAGAWTASTVDSVLDGVRAVTAADIDGDGDDDLAATLYFAEEVLWWENTAGDGSAWTVRTVNGSFDGGQSLRAVDLDRDGDIDLLGAAELGDTIAFFENVTGTGSGWITTTVASGFDGAHDAAAADVDGDGDIDVVGVAEVDDDVAWFENTVGDGSAFTERTVDSFLNGARGVAAVDFDRDGDIDIVATRSKDGGAVAWYESTAGDGSAWTERQILAPLDGATALAVGDLDRNGLLDVVATADLDDEVALARDLGGQASTTTTDVAPSALGNSLTAELLRIRVTNEGRAGERDAELARVELLFEETTGDPLTPSEVQSIFASVTLFLDDPGGASPGVFDGADPALVSAAPPVVDSDGVLSLIVADGLAAVELEPGDSLLTFVVVETTADYDSQGLSFVQVTHLTETGGPGRTVVEDRGADLTLRLAYEENTTTDPIPVSPGGSSTDLAISIADSVDPAVAGETVTYTVTVSNNGAAAALDVVVSSVLSAGLDFVSTLGCQEDLAGFPTCSLGNIGAGAQAQFDLLASIDSGATGSVSLDASVTSSSGETNPGDESAVESTTVAVVGDLSVTKTVEEVQYIDGESITWTVVVTNDGPSDIAGATVVDTIPAEVSGATWTCTADAGASCTANGSGDVSDVVSLPAGTSVTFSITGIVDADTTGPITNTATASVPGSASDPDGANDSDSVTSTFADPIFRDGFESAGTGAWDVTVGGSP